MNEWKIKILVKHDTNECSVCNRQECDSGLYVSTGDGRWLCVECAVREEQYKIFMAKQRIHEISHAISLIEDNETKFRMRVAFNNAKGVETVRRNKNGNAGKKSEIQVE